MATAPSARSPLTRERILEAALELADAGGIESLSMRKLGQALGFEAMSLYNHVRGKKDVLDGILDLVLAETETPSPDADWAVAVKESAMSVHRVLRQHKWAATLLMSPDHPRPARLQFIESLLGRLRDAGFSAEATYHAYHVLDAFIFGYAVWYTSHTYTEEELRRLIAMFAQMITPDEFPHLHEHAEQHVAEGPHREVNAFEYGLDLILDGLERVRVRESG